MSKLKTGQFDKFQFDTDFFEVSVEQSAKDPGTSKKNRPSPLAPPEPEIDIEALKAEAYAAGHAAGVQETNAAHQTDLQATLDTFAQAVSKVEAAQNLYLRDLTSQALTVLAQSLKQLVGDAALHYPEEILHTHLQEMLPLLPKDEQLILRIHPKARDFHEKLTGHIANIRGVIFKIETDASLALGDCAVMWEGGGVDTTLAYATENLATLLQSFRPDEKTVADNLKQLAQEAVSTPEPMAPTPENDTQPQETGETDTTPIAPEEELA